MSVLGCFLDPASCLTTIGKSTMSDLFAALTSWVAGSVEWVLTACANVLAAPSDASSVVTVATGEYDRLLVVVPFLLLLSMLIATIQRLKAHDAGGLWRLYFGVLPAAILMIVCAPTFAHDVLQVTNDVASYLVGPSTINGSTLATMIASLSTVVPGFGIFLMALLMIVGSLLLWCELVVRDVVLSFLLVLVPLVAAFFPLTSLRRATWRLIETFCLTAVSKVVVVLTLALGFAEVTSNATITIVTGAVTLFLATASPFILLRLVPVLESSALQGVDLLRQRALHTLATAPQSPWVRTAQALLPAVEMPPPSTPEDYGIPMWETTGEVVSVPDYDGPRPLPPTGTPVVRHGHKHIYTDEGGPVIGWHWDD